MCNAHNHPESCDCGWGQKGGVRMKNSRQGSLFNRWPRDIPPILPNFFSISVPNSKCPVCHEPVFYYCNEHGSSVFFDSVGPPWPKHPCTDSSLPPLAIEKISNNQKTNFLSVAQSSGWQVVKLVDFFKISEKAYKLTLKLSETESKVLYIPSANIKSRQGLVLFSEEALCFVKVDANDYHVSMLSEQLTVVESIAYENEPNL